MNARSRTIVALASCAAALVAMPSGGGAAPAPLRFGPAVQVSPELANAWEPTLVIDRFGNIFMTARKDTSSQILLAPDDRSPTATRSMSWLWSSADGGKTWANLPAALPFEAANHEWGYEGDLALDDAGHLYFVDQTYADATLTRWTVTGRGAYTVDFHRPLVPTGQPVDDRPWLAAHGDGSVFYIAQAGDPLLNPVSERTGGEAYGPGRYAVYRSTDGATTFETAGRSLSESGACRPAADHRAGSRNVYVVCTNDGGQQESLTSVPHGRGKLWGYVSHDDGATFTRVQVGDYNADAETFFWPVVAVGPKGDVWVLHVDADRLDDGGIPESSRLNLYHSKDEGRTWSKRDVTPTKGFYQWGSLAISPAGDIGIGVLHRPNTSSAWGAYASVFAPDSVPSLVKVGEVAAATASRPIVETLGLAFDADGAVAFAWHQNSTENGLTRRRVFFARSLPAPAVPRPRPPPRVAGEEQSRTLPATGVALPLWPAAAVLAAGAVLATWLTRRPRSRRAAG